MPTITLKLERYAEDSVEVDRDEYEQAKADGKVDHLLDVYLSDREYTTTVTEPDGTEIDPYA